MGFYGVETDGQFEGASCSDPTHSHHGVANSFDAQLKATQRFNAQLKARGLYQTGADAYVFSGANRWNAADTVPPPRPFRPRSPTISPYALPAGPAHSGVPV